MNLSILSRCGLFRGVPADRLPSLLRRIGAYTRAYEKEQPVYRIGDTAHALCVLLSGSVTIEPRRRLGPPHHP